MEVRHAQARVAAVELHWAEIGHDADARPLVLLHGLQDSYLTWKRVAPEFARDRRVLMLDLPGHGLSERPDAAYDLPWYTSVVAAWLASVGLAEVDIVGHSLGGGIAQMLLLECRERIGRLVLAAPGGLGREITLLLRLASIPHVVEQFGQPFFATIARLALGGVVVPEDLTELMAMNARSGSARAFARTVRDLVDWSGQRRLFTHRADEIPVLPPIAVLWGEDDKIIPAKHARALADRVDGLQITVLASCGHFLHHEQPELFARLVREFLEAPDAAPARLRGRESQLGVA